MTEMPEGYGLGPEWETGEDGIPYREAARVVVLDGRGRALLVRGHDRNDPQYTWWFTVGGGRQAGEDPRTAACRELVEETGLRARPEDLEGPVLRRESLFHFSAVTCRQDEDFFVLRLRASGVDGDAGETGDTEHGVDTAGWTDLEREVLDELAWWDPDDLAAHRDAGHLVFPRQLPELVRAWHGGIDPTAPVPLIREIDE